MTSDEHVDVKLLNGTLTADRLSILNSGEVVRFEGNVVMNLVMDSPTQLEPLEAREKTADVEDAAVTGKVTLAMIFIPQSFTARLAQHGVCARAGRDPATPCAQSTMQGVPNAMQGFSQNRDQPIQIEAASLEVRDKKKEAIFSGNVKVVQGDTTMTRKRWSCFTIPARNQARRSRPSRRPRPHRARRSQAQPGPTGSSSIKRLEARGNVVVTQKQQVVTGDLAIVDTKANLMTMTGGVVLTQCKNVLKGDRLLVDMTTGTSRVESDSGRVQGLFVQGRTADPGRVRHHAGANSAR